MPAFESHSDDSTATDSGTWHFGLIARWWDEFNVADPDEIARLRAGIETFGQPALDVGCGTGRLLRPLLAAGLEVDGVDVSGDMLDRCAARARDEGVSPRLVRQAMHELDLGRTYRTIFACGALGIGGRRDRDREALRRIHAHLEPGGAALIDQELPWNGRSVAGWARWLPGHRDDLPGTWPATGDRRTAADGDELELITRLGSLDPLAQRHTYELRARRWRGSALLEEETYALDECLYFPQELLEMFRNAGFGEVTVEGGYTGREATADDGVLLFVARR